MSVSIFGETWRFQVTVFSLKRFGRFECFSALLPPEAEVEHNVVLTLGTVLLLSAKLRYIIGDGETFHRHFRPNCSLHNKFSNR